MSMIRIYDTASHYHMEPDMDPFEVDKMIEMYGDNWREVLKDAKEEYEFYNFEDDVI